MFTQLRSQRPRKFTASETNPLEYFEVVSSGYSSLLGAVLPPQLSLELGPYQLRLATSEMEREAACRLRFNVFNVELGEGLRSSLSTGLDTDEFDYVCDHLIVEDRTMQAIVGTYRMQSGTDALNRLGYYSAREFDFSPYEPARDQVLELGRASIDREHRGSEVLTLLWRGIARYCRHYGLRYLIGCSSMNSQEAREGWSVYQQLSPFLTAPEFRTTPTASFVLPTSDAAEHTPVRIPKLLKTYIGVGARICSEPAWDHEFGTIDFLTLLDLQQLTPAARNRFLLDDEQ